MFSSLFLHIHDDLSSWPDETLTILLLIASASIAGIALFSKNNTLKGLVLAYVVLP